jgi:UrcA family protein
MRKFIMSLTTVASLSLAAVPVLGLTQAANAAEARDSTITVSFADLNLANPAQAKIFKARIQAAGETVCRAKMNRGELQSTVRACMADAHRDAERQLSQRQLNALAQANTAPVQVAAR